MIKRYTKQEAEAKELQKLRRANINAQNAKTTASEQITYIIPGVKSLATIESCIEPIKETLGKVDRPFYHLYHDILMRAERKYQFVKKFRDTIDAIPVTESKITDNIKQPAVKPTVEEKCNVVETPVESVVNTNIDNIIDNNINKTVENQNKLSFDEILKLM